MVNFYNKGDIVLFKNIMLINNDGIQTIDTRIKGHPFIILNDINEFGEIALCLKCSSSTVGKRKNFHFKVDSIKMKGMKQKTTYIEMNHIYKIRIDNFISPVGRVSNKLLTELEEKIKQQNNFE